MRILKTAHPTVVTEEAFEAFATTPSFEVPAPDATIQFIEWKDPDPAKRMPAMCHITWLVPELPGKTASQIRAERAERERHAHD